MKSIKILFILLFPINSWSTTLVTTNLNLNISRPYAEGSIKFSGYKKEFVEQIKRIENKKYLKCSKHRAVPKETPRRMEVWWSYLALNCIELSYRKDKNKLQKAIKRHIKIIEQYKGDKSSLATHLTHLLVNLSEKKNYIISALEENFLDSNERYLSSRDKAKFYNFKALRLKLNKKLVKAADLYFKAYNISNEQIYATKLKNIIKSEPELLKLYQKIEGNSKKINGKEIQTSKFKRYYRTGQKTKAISEGVRLLNINKTTERSILSKMFSVLRRKVKTPLFKGSVAKVSLGCHANCLYEIGLRFYKKHKYEIARSYAEKSYSKGSVKAIILVGLSHLQLGNYKLAKISFSEGLSKSVNHSENYFESLFRLGLVNFRLKNYTTVDKLFSNLDSLKEKNNFNLQMIYWHWRALQKVKNKKEAVVRDKLVKLYPLTYYGLLANQEKNKGKLILPTESKVIQKEMVWSAAKIISWENFKDFAEIQWFDLAKKELKYLFNKEDDVEAVLYSYYSSAIADHYQAIKIMNIIWDKNPYAYFTKDTLKLTLPVEYDSFIKDYSKRNNLEINLIRSLIKQESSFILKAKSGSNAMGLMQIIPVTAKDAAKFLRLSTKNISRRIYEPELNVRLGTSYLRRLVRAFKGHTPLALASYNAGIGNMRRWMKQRPVDLEELQTKNSSASEDEVWIDELPWAETSFYVKSIMRNLILYRFYYQNIKKIPEPSWAGSQILK